MATTAMAPTHDGEDTNLVRKLEKLQGDGDQVL